MNRQTMIAFAVGALCAAFYVGQTADAATDYKAMCFDIEALPQADSGDPKKVAAVTTVFFNSQIESGRSRFIAVENHGQELVCAW